MAKRVQLVLTQDVSKLGKLGDLVDVAPGYARNYLVPKKLGTPATPGILKQFERRRELERQRPLQDMPGFIVRVVHVEIIRTAARPFVYLEGVPGCCDLNAPNAARYYWFCHNRGPYTFSSPHQ